MIPLKLSKEMTLAAEALVIGTDFERTRKVLNCCVERDCLGISLGHGDNSLFCCIDFPFPSRQLREWRELKHDMRSCVNQALWLTPVIKHLRD